jgi:hypothetical protein
MPAPFAGISRDLLSDKVPHNLSVKRNQRNTCTLRQVHYPLNPASNSLSALRTSSINSFIFP